MTNAFSKDRIELLNLLSSQIAISIENSRLMKEVVEVTKEKAKASTAMEIAKDMQTCLIPNSPVVGGFDISVYMETCDEVGGDYFDVINDGTRDWFIIGDVSGHGVKSGMVMMMAQVAIHTALKFFEEKSNLEDIIQKVNQVISTNISIMNAEKYISFSIFLREEDKFHFLGLHLPVILFRAKEKTIEILETTGSWLGYCEFMNDFPLGEFQMNSGDILFLYTDGVTEGRNHKGEMLMDTGIKNFLLEFYELNTEELKKEFLKILLNYENEDDITFMIIKKK
ncbi:MAG: SpoIIE family protein phosphatase [Leptospiraceae bacterium]|nr:SpoIIE family protein phosphatase [Leptospiraceae bacterium]